MPINLKEFCKFINIQVKENKIEADFIISADLPYFDGHFPDNPILPAIGIIDCSVELLQQVQCKEVEILDAKFAFAAKPNEEVHIECIQSTQNHWQITWKSKKTKETISRLNLHF